MIGGSIKMNLNVGDKIRCLRHEKDITQEEFAAILGVSCQSVSRWENGICYPDIELLPDIAEFFGVTVDCLMGINETVRKEKIAKYLEQFQEAVSQGRIDDCITVARNGIAEFPNSYMLLNKLMYALFLAGDSDGNIPEWQENMKKIENCLECGQCSSRCPYELDTPNLLKKNYEDYKNILAGKTVIS